MQPDHTGKAARLTGAPCGRVESPGTARTDHPVPLSRRKLVISKQRA
jgi:hypothetical protein